MDSNHTKFIEYTSRVFAKTAEALPACGSNQFMREKVAHSIDRDKVAAMEHLVKSASLLSDVGKGFRYGMGGGLGILAPLAAGAYLFGPSAAHAAGKGVAAGTAEATEDKAREYMKYLLPVAAVLGIGGTARAGLLGDKAQGVAKSVTDALGDLVTSTKEPKKEEKPAAEPGTEAYKVAAAKTFYNLSIAKEACNNAEDLEKISAAHDECAQILFDCIFYL